MKKEDEILCQKHGEWSSFLILPTPHEAGIVYYYLHFRSAQSLSRVRLFATPWTAACQASLSITNSQSLLKPMSIELVMPSNHPILCRPFSTLHLSKWGLGLWGPFTEVTQRQDGIRFAGHSLDADAFKSRSWNKNLGANILFRRGFCDWLIASQLWCTLQYVGEEPLEKEIATHSSILAWKIPWMEEPGRLQSLGLQRVVHDWATSLLIKEFLLSISPLIGTHCWAFSDKEAAGCCWRGRVSAISMPYGTQLWVRGHSVEPAHGSKCGPSVILQPRCVDNLCATPSVWIPESEAQLTCSEGLLSPLPHTPHPHKSGGAWLLPQKGSGGWFLAWSPFRPAPA